jgi:pyrroline-5-carboxylate reductase
MGRALGLALLEKGILTPDKLLISSRSGGDTYSAWPEVRDIRDNQELVDHSDLIVLSVRPEHLDELSLSAGNKPVVSLLAMASCETIKHHTGSERIIRAMPNAAAQIGQAYMPWYATPETTKADRAIAQQLLNSCGKARELSTEQELEYMTALSGGGPAYPALLASAMLANAKANGIDDEIAHEAVMQTLAGGSWLLSHLNAAPTDMVNRLIDYRGTTAKGLQALIDQGFQDVVSAGLDSAHNAAKNAY